MIPFMRTNFRLRPVAASAPGTCPPLLPLHQDPARFLLPLVMMVLSFLACLSVAATLMLSDLSAQWEHRLEDGMTITMPGAFSGTFSGTGPNQKEPNQDIITEANRRNRIAVTKRLQETAGILRVTPVPEAETRQMMQSLLGIAGTSDLNNSSTNSDVLAGLALPQLLDVRIDPAVPIDPLKLRKRLADIHPGIDVVAHKGMARTLTAPARLARIIGLTVIGSTLLLCGLVIALVVRASLRAHEHLIHLLSLLGATDQSLMGVLRRHIWRATLPGALGGLGLAVLALRGTSHLFLSDSMLFATRPPDTNGIVWVLMTSMPLLLTGMALWISHRTMRIALNGQATHDSHPARDPA